MSTATGTPPREDDRVRRWRREQLEAAGYPPWAAAILGERESIDLHQACSLLRAGCPVETAWCILV